MYFSTDSVIELANKLNFKRNIYFKDETSTCIKFMNISVLEYIKEYI